jgi:acylphosphatase
LNECRRFFITGRVQGVFFRAGTQEQARRLGLSGYARNLADGRVEVLAVGPMDALDKLAVWLSQGPPHARVDAVEYEPVEVPPVVGFTTG